MNRRPRPIRVVVALAAVFGLAACSPSTTPDPGDKLRVVVTASVFADLVANVGGDDVDVRSLVPRGADVHTYAPTPTDVRAVAEADVLVRNGLGLDDWLSDLMLDAQAGSTTSVDLGRGPGFELIGGDEPGTPNPHLWLSVPYAIRYVDQIEATLAAADPPSAAEYAARADAYRDALRALDGRIRQQVGGVAPEDRKIVTFHDALPYFAREYGLEIVGVAVEAPGQEPSAGEIAELIEAIRARGVRAIFSESQFPSGLVERIAAETEANVVADLYTDSLGDAPVDSYIAMMEWNVDRMVEALR